MPRASKGPRLWLRPARRNGAGVVTHAARYPFLDSGVQHATGCGPEQVGEAGQALAAHIAEKYAVVISTEKRDPTATPIRDVLALDLKDVVGAVAVDGPPERPDVKAAHALQSRAGHRIKRPGAFFGHRMLADVNGALYREYVRQSSTSPMARRDLEDLRAAINHRCEEGLHDRIVSVVLPDRQPPRERWLGREEAARLLWAAWRRAKCKQVAKFIRVGLYTAHRAAVVGGASFVREEGRTWVDLKRGMLRPPERARKTKKRNPPIPLPAGLLGHLRRWHRAGSRYVVQWGEHSVGRVDKTVGLIAAEIGSGHVGAARVPPHCGDLANASRHRFMGSEQVPWHDGPDARGNLRPPPAAAPITSA